MTTQDGGTALGPWQPPLEGRPEKHEQRDQLFRKDVDTTLFFIQSGKAKITAAFI